MWEEGEIEEGEIARPTRMVSTVTGLTANQLPAVLAYLQDNPPPVKKSRLQVNAPQMCSIAPTQRSKAKIAEYRQSIMNIRQPYVYE